MAQIEPRVLRPTGRAAQYVRMSREHQNYSIEHQSAVIAGYAASRALEIVKTYTDDGRSGLRIENRGGLQQLLADVIAGRADFTRVLVYDVSRWGRFQDADESAHYEFLCRQSGVQVEYCAELFDNDGSLASTLLKQLKRSMAGEFSRELSAKVVLGQRRLAAMGFWQGGPPGYGLRRQLISDGGEPGPIMQRGEQKALKGSRVVLVHGPLEEIAVVRRIFSMFVTQGLSRPSIARRLNAESLTADGGVRWTPFRVRQVLENERWVGAQTYGKTTCRLGAPPERSPRAAWVRVEGLLDAIVSHTLFGLAQRNIERHVRIMSRAEMLTGLAGLLDVHGRLTGGLINDAEHLPCAQTYGNVFGGLLQAYAQVGYRPKSRAIAAASVARAGMACKRRNRLEPLSPSEMIDRLRRLYERAGKLTAEVINDEPDLPSSSEYQRVFGSAMLAYELAGYLPTAKQRKASLKRTGAIGGIAGRTAKLNAGSNISLG